MRVWTHFKQFYWWSVCFLCDWELQHTEVLCLSWFGETIPTHHIWGVDSKFWIVIEKIDPIGWLAVVFCWCLTWQINLKVKFGKMSVDSLRCWSRELPLHSYWYNLAGLCWKTVNTTFGCNFSVISAKWKKDRKMFFWGELKQSKVLINFLMWKEGNETKVLLLRITASERSEHQLLW